MPRTFVVSDTHSVFHGGKKFTHWARVGDNPIVKYGEYFAELHHEYVTKWNSIVGPKDTVIHLGDVIWDERKLGIFDHLNGKKILVAGNHDREDGKIIAQSLQYFTQVCNYYTDGDIIFSHMPLCPDVNKFAYDYYDGIDLTPYIGNVHGHFHSEGLTKEFIKDSNSAYKYTTNTGLVYHSIYHTPVDLQVVRERIKAQYCLNMGIQVSRETKPKKVFSGIFRKKCRTQKITV